MKSQVLRLALYCVRAAGGFSIAQFATRKRLRILCYHGFSLGDEHIVAPFMFIRRETFARRMQVLRKRGIPVISLNDGVQRLRAGEINNCETVITFDDGWLTNLTVGLPILQQYGYPACIYVTTDHLAAGTEVFNVVLGYMINRSTRTAMTLQNIHPSIDGVYEIKSDPVAATAGLIRTMERDFTVEQRQALLPAFATSLGFDLNEVLAGGRFSLLKTREMRLLADSGIDIQLHTHTHRLPVDSLAAVATEINDNRAALQSVARNDLAHFCYPSGHYGAQHPQWLASLGIVSATTCDPGLNSRETSPLLLNRYLDREDASSIEFEAEIVGVREIARLIRQRLKNIFAGKT